MERLHSRPDGNVPMGAAKHIHKYSKRQRLILFPLSQERWQQASIVFLSSL